MPSNKKKSPPNVAVVVEEVRVVKLSLKQKRINRQKEAEQRNRELRRDKLPTAWDRAKARRAERRAQPRPATPTENLTESVTPPAEGARAARRRLASH